MIRAGMPTAVEPGGTSSMTTAFAPILQSSPTVIPPRMQAPQPMSTRSPMVGMSCVPVDRDDAHRRVLADLDVVADRPGVEDDPAVVPDPDPPAQPDRVGQRDPGGALDEQEHHPIEDVRGARISLDRMPIRQLPNRWTATAQNPCSKTVPPWVRRSSRRSARKPIPAGLPLWSPRLSGGGRPGRGPGDALGDLRHRDLGVSKT